MKNERTDEMTSVVLLVSVLGALTLVMLAGSFLAGWLFTLVIGWWG